MAFKDSNSQASEKLEEVQSELMCSICHDYFTEATTLLCSHSFCLNCIKSWRRSHNDCPVCRTRIRGMAPSRALDNMVSAIANRSTTTNVFNRTTNKSQNANSSTATSPGLTDQSEGANQPDIDNTDDDYDDDDNDDWFDDDIDFDDEVYEDEDYEDENEYEEEDEEEEEEEEGEYEDYEDEDFGEDEDDYEDCDDEDEDDEEDYSDDDDEHAKKSNENNPNNDAYWRKRGWPSRPANWRELIQQ